MAKKSQINRDNKRKALIESLGVRFMPAIRTLVTVMSIAAIGHCQI